MSRTTRRIRPPLPSRPLLKPLLPSALASVVLHAAILLGLLLSARGCRDGIQAQPGGEMFRQIGLARLPDPASDRADAPTSTAAADSPASAPSLPLPDVESVVPDELPDDIPPVSPPRPSDSLHPEPVQIVGPGMSLAERMLRSVEPPSAAGSRQGGGSRTPGPGETSFMDIPDSGRRIVYVIDTSGSMNDDGRMGLAQAQLEKSLTLLRPDQSFQVIFYGDAPQEMILRGRARGLHQATLPNIRMAVSRIRQVIPGGGTSHLPALSRAFALRPDVIYFLTDGRNASHTRREFEDVLRQNRSGARIHVIEFAGGPPESRELTWLHRLAAETGGQYRRVEL